MSLCSLSFCCCGGGRSLCLQATMGEGGSEHFADTVVHATHTEPPHAVAFIVVAMTLGILSKIYLSRSAIPLTVMMFILGAIFGVLGLFWTVVDENTDIRNIDPHLIFFIFLPLLIFESAFYCDVHVFERLLWQSIMLAVPGLLIATMLTACISRFMYPEWSWIAAILFGAIVSATDPVAVVALLRDLGCSKKLATLIEGESLLNDGTAIVLYSLLKGAVIAGRLEGGFGEMLLEFLRTCSLGIITGLVIGYITVGLLRTVFNDPVVEITLTVTAAYGTFYVAEGLLHSSGVLALVALGVFLGDHRSSISPEVEHAMHEFWGVLVWSANNLIFALLGVIIVHQIKDNNIVLKDLMWAGILYLAINIIRFIVVFIHLPIFRCFKYSLTVNEGILTAFGGLRGAVGVVLALSISTDPNIQEVGGGYPAKVVFLMAVIVCGTLVINGCLCGPLIQRLELDTISHARRLQTQEAFNAVILTQETQMQILKQDRFLVHCNWGWVKRLAFDRLNDPYSKCPVVATDDLDYMGEALTAYYRAFKASVQKNFEEGIITPWVHRQLMNIAEEAAEEGHFINSRSIEKMLAIPPLLRIGWKLRFLHPFLKGAMFHRIYRATLMSFGFFYGLEDVIRHRDQFIAGRHHDDAERIAREIEEQAIVARAAVLKDIQLVNAKYPDVLMAVKTRVAARNILNMGRLTLTKLGHDGALDMSDCEALIALVEQRMKDVLRNCPHYLDPQSALEMLRNSDLYLAASSKIQARLLNRAQVQHLDEEAVVYGVGGPASVHMIVDGIVVRELEDGNCDYLGPGQWLGFYPTLTGGTHATKTTAETRVTMVTINADVFIEAVKACPSLERYVWKLCGRLWCSRMMRRVQPYKDWSHFKRARWTLNGEIVELYSRGDPKHVADVQFTSVRVRLQPGHTYVLVHGRCRVERDRRDIPRARSSESLAPDSLLRLATADDSLRQNHSGGESLRQNTEVLVPSIATKPTEYLAPCLLPTTLRYIRLSPDSKLFHIPPADGLWNLGDLSEKLEVNVSALHHDKHDDGLRSREGSHRSHRSQSASPELPAELALALDPQPSKSSNKDNKPKTILTCKVTRNTKKGTADESVPSSPLVLLKSAFTRKNSTAHVNGSKKAETQEGPGATDPDHDNLSEPSIPEDDLAQDDNWWRNESPTSMMREDIESGQVTRTFEEAVCDTPLTRSSFVRSFSAAATPSSFSQPTMPAPADGPLDESISGATGLLCPQEASPVSAPSPPVHKYTPPIVASRAAGNSSNSAGGSSPRSLSKAGDNASLDAMHLEVELLPDGHSVGSRANSVCLSEAGGAGPG